VKGRIKNLASISTLERSIPGFVTSSLLYSLSSSSSPIKLRFAHDSGIIDCGYEGCKYTWSNNQEGGGFGRGMRELHSLPMEDEYEAELIARIEEHSSQ
jgi:hypothetical protein